VLDLPGGSDVHVLLQPGPVTDWDSASRSDTARYAKYFWGMLERGVYLPCSQYECLFLSTAHTDADIDATLTAAQEVLPTLR